MAAGQYTNGTCGGACEALHADEWLAIKEFFDVSADNRSVVVNKRAPRSGTYLKKSEAHSSTLPPSESVNLTLLDLGRAPYVLYGGQYI